MKASELILFLQSKKQDATLISLYGASWLDHQRSRYVDAVKAFIDLYGDRDVALFSAPGRSEISGNHTDHNGGLVLAAAIDLDILVVASRRSDDKICVKSHGFKHEDRVTAADTAPDPSAFGTSASLLRGLCHAFLSRGYAVCGFDAYTTSSVKKGAGVSSSAAFEVAMATVINHFACEGRVSPPEIAELSQIAERDYFGKPCGLMDQTASSVGGFSFIDFGEEKAKIEEIPFDLARVGYSLCLTNTGGSHADLTDDYAAVPTEMKAVASYFGHERLRPLSLASLWREAPSLRKTVGDRALLRAYHYIKENERVAAQAAALREGRFSTFLSLVRESGRSSYEYLQNVYAPKEPKEQGIAVALALSEELLSPLGDRAACRLHGGGFAGTVQAFVPTSFTERYRAGMEAIFGPDSCTVLSVRKEGALRIL